MDLFKVFLHAESAVKDSLLCSTFISLQVCFPFLAHLRWFIRVWVQHCLTLAVRKALRCGLKDRTGWSATRFRNLSRAFILVSTNSSEKRSTTPFITNFSGSGWRQRRGGGNVNEGRLDRNAAQRGEACGTYRDEVGRLAVL